LRREEHSLNIQRIVSVHFPKAGGSSLRAQLTMLLGDQVELDYGHDPLTSTGDQKAMFPAGKRVVHGHFRPHRYDSADAFRMTFLRYPVANLMSIYFFWKTFPEHGNPVHTQFLREQPDVFQFALYPALARLMSDTYFGGYDMARFDFIGFHESRAQDIHRLGLTLELPLRSEVHENPTLESLERRVLESGPAAIGRLRDLLAPDVAFYDRTRSMWSVRSRG
jgi:hypothetical protein